MYVPSTIHVAEEDAAAENLRPEVTIETSARVVSVWMWNKIMVLYDLATSEAFGMEPLKDFKGNLGDFNVVTEDHFKRNYDAQVGLISRRAA